MHNIMSSDQFESHNVVLMSGVPAPSQREAGTPDYLRWASIGKGSSMALKARCH